MFNLHLENLELHYEHKPNLAFKINLRLRPGRTEHSSSDGGAWLQPAYCADGKRGWAYAFYNGSRGVSSRHRR